MRINWLIAAYATEHAPQEDYKEICVYSTLQATIDAMKFWFARDDIREVRIFKVEKP